MPKQFKLFVILCLGFLGSIASAQAQGPTVIIETLDDSQFPEIHAVVSVVNAGKAPIEGLEAQDFTIFEGERLLSQISVDTETPSSEPIAVALVLDLSGSAPLADVQRAGQQFVESLKPQDRVALIGFNSPLNPDPKSFDPFKEANFTATKGLIAEIIASFETHGESAVYEAILKGVAVTAQENTARKAVLVMSDGYDFNSRPEIASADDPEMLARQNNIPIFTVGIASPDASFDSNLDYLSALASKTGGRYQEATDSTTMGGLFEEVSQQLRHQYSLTFQVEGRRDGQKHPLTIRANNPDGQGVIEETITLDYPEPPEIPEIYRLQRDLNSELKFIDSTSVLRDKILLVPDIGAKNPIVRVDYQVDGQPLDTVNAQNVTAPQYKPWEYWWDTTTLGEGAHELTIIAHDDTDNQSQPFTVVVEIGKPSQEATPTPEPQLTDTPSAEPTTLVVSAAPTVAATTPTSIVDSSTLIIIIAIVIVLLIIVAALIYMWWQRRQEDPPPVPNVTPFAPESDRTDWQQTGSDGNNIAPTGGGEAWPSAAYQPPTDLSPQQHYWDDSNAITSLDNEIDEYGLSSNDKTEILFVTNKLPVTGLLIIQENVGDLNVGQTFPLTERETTIGRMEDNHIMLPDSSVSRHHAKITLEGVVFRLHDLKSANGSKVNNEKVDSQLLNENDRIEFGRIKMLFVILDRET